MNKFLVLLIVLFTIGGGVYYFSGNSTPDRGGDGQMAGDDASNTSTMRAEENMVVVTEQKPSSTITSSLIVLAESGYLVIHEDNNGAPGAVLGSSALLPAGENSRVEVALSRLSRDGETLHAMLHFEKGGNTTFSAAEDTPVPSQFGGFISGFFDISADAPDDIPMVI